MDLLHMKYCFVSIFQTHVLCPAAQPWVAWTLNWSKKIQDGGLGTCLAALLLISGTEHRGREELSTQESSGEKNWGRFVPCSWSLALCLRVGGGGSYKEHIRERTFAVALG